MCNGEVDSCACYAKIRTGSHITEPESVKKALPVIIIVLFAVLGSQYFENRDSAPPSPATATRSLRDSVTDSDEAIEQAYRDRRSNTQVNGVGTVTRLLPDDNDGERHQRFVLELASGQTLLVAHNIELASRIDELRRGDRVGFYGEYEWNEQGGVIHWTHHDPAGRHIGGWLEHNGRRYE